MEKKRTLVHVGGNMNWYSHCGERFGGSSEVWSSHPTSGYLSKENENTSQERYMYSMLTALFTIAKIWKELKCPLDSTTQPYKEGNLAICVNMGRPWGHYAKWHSQEKDEHHVIFCMYNLKTTSTKNGAHRYREHTGACQRQEVGEMGQKVQTCS